MAQKFIDDEPGYRRWLAAHPNGFVLNCERSPRSRYLKLHVSTCWTISNEPTNGKLWTKDYIKICAASRDGISGWIREEPDLRGASMSECRFCLER